MSSHDQKQEDRILALEIGQRTTQEILNSVNEKLDPIMETYRTVAILGKWMMAFFVFLSIVIGIILGLKDFIKK